MCDGRGTGLFLFLIVTLISIYVGIHQNAVVYEVQNGVPEGLILDGVSLVIKVGYEP